MQRHQDLQAQTSRMAAAPARDAAAHQPAPMPSTRCGLRRMGFENCAAGLWTLQGGTGRGQGLLHAVTGVAQRPLAAFIMSIAGCCRWRLAGSSTSCCRVASVRAGRHLRAGAAGAGRAAGGWVRCGVRGRRVGACECWCDIGERPKRLLKQEGTHARTKLHSRRA